jgi:23S rRNA pseudouridine955/2504/2580 synthase
MKDLSKVSSRGQVAVSIEEVDEGSAGQRVDNFLLKVLKGVPKSHVYRILRKGEVRVNGRRIDASYRLIDGDRVRIPPIRVSEGTKPERLEADTALNAPILFEDDAFLVVDKPAGLAVHGGSGVSSGLIERLRYERKKAKFLELVHRLDRETSGILMVAKKRQALIHLQNQLREKSTDKRYWALVVGHLPEAEVRVSLPLHKYTLANGERRVMVHREGQSAQTIFRTCREFDEWSLVEAELLTGRTHQIRVHLAHLGHPILGDDKYGDFALNKLLQRRGLKRMFLHAHKLHLRHPETEAKLVIESPLATELSEFLETI